MSTCWYRVHPYYGNAQLRTAEHLWIVWREYAVTGNFKSWKQENGSKEAS